MQRLALYLLIAFFVAASGGSLFAEIKTLTILHTNDMHARFVPDDQKQGGFAYLTSAMNQVRANCRDCLTLNAGDTVQGSPVSTLYRGLPVYEVVNAMGFDCSTLGNHEFDYGWQRIKDFEKTARFPLLNANVVDKDGKPLMKRQWVVRKVNGLRVGLIGVLMGDLEKLATPTRLGPYHSIDPVEAIRKYLPVVKAKSDVIIVLTHTDPKVAERILQEIPDVQAVINGHDHNGAPELARVDGRVVARLKSYGRELGILKLEIDKQKRSLVSANWTIKAIDSPAIQPDPKVAQLVASWETKVAEKLEVVIGESKRDFPTRSSLQSVFERAIREQLGVDIAYQNPGGVRDTMVRGPIRERKIWELMPFDNALVWGKFKGSELPEVIRKRQTIDPDKEYTFATNDFIAETENVQRWGNLNFTEKGPMIRDLMIEWVRKVKVIE